MLERLIISAPFGNWHNIPHTTSTVGTFTRQRRGGALYRLWRCLRTIRWYPGIGAVKNKLGLPNPGIDWLRQRVNVGHYDVSAKIVSVAARTTKDWQHLIAVVGMLQPAPLRLELNVSCPNCGDADESDYAEVFARAVERIASGAIVKLPPVGYERYVELALHAGITGFHCCNTLPTGNGGLSGKPLKPLSLAAVKHVSATVRGRPGAVVIGGGGVTGMNDVLDYLTAGATHVAVGSTLLLPWRWGSVRRLAQALHQGDQLAAATRQAAPLVLKQ